MRNSTKLFWIALIAPATLALASYLLGQVSEEMRLVGYYVGMADLGNGLVASIYCAFYLARCIEGSTTTKIVCGLGLLIGIALVNFIILCVGCGSNVFPPSHNVMPLK